MSKITYANKVALNENSDIADINKVKAEDMNEIKDCVNNNDDKLSGTTSAGNMSMTGLTVNGGTQLTNGLYSMAAGNVGTAVGNGNLIIKKANNTEAPNNGVVLEFGNSANWTGQLYIGDNSTQGCYFNGWSNGTRGTWKKLVFLEDVVESGGNVNGYYTKYGDGTLICRYFVGPITTNAGAGTTTAVTFPYAFVDANWTGTLTMTNGQAYWSYVFTNVGDKSKKGFNLKTWNNGAGVNSGQYFDYIAIGRWK